jgi:predicted PurR-regulated permease PerM
MSTPDTRGVFRNTGGAGANGVTTALFVIVAIAVLWFGRDLFIPFALAVLLSFALAPLVRRLRSLGLGRILPVLVSVALAFALIAGLAVVVGNQLVQLAGNLPSYEHNIRQKVASIKPDTGSGVLGRAAAVVRDLQREVAEAPAGAPPERDTGAGPPPVPVEIHEPPTSPLDVIRNVAVPLLAPVVTAGLVIVFLIFMLLERENLRDRFIALVGRGQMHVTTEALDEAAQRVSRYLLMQLVVNVTYGIPLALGLWLIGVPNAVLWGVLAALLRFLPYVGPFIAALFPIALAFAVDPGWSMILWVVALIVTLELISNNFVEPLLYGASAGISAIAVILSAIFWTTLWGPVGLFLATPLTVCLAVIGRYVPALRFFDVLLGAEPVLAPEERLYQRLLAGREARP